MRKCGRRRERGDEESSDQKNECDMAAVVVAMANFHIFNYPLTMNFMVVLFRVA